MSDRRAPAAGAEAGIRASGQGQVMVLKGAAVGKSELGIRILRPPSAHVPMQHQTGWQPPIITR